MGLAPIPTFADATNYPAGANPWNGQPIKVKPTQAYFVPGTGAAATEANYELNLVTNAIKSAMVSAAIANFSAKTLGSALPITETFGHFAGFVYDVVNSQWIGAYFESAGNQNGIVGSFDGGRTWRSIFQQSATTNGNCTAVAINPTTSQVMMVEDGATNWVSVSITPGGAAVTTTGHHVMTTATAFFLGDSVGIGSGHGFFFVLYANQVVGNFTGFFEQCAYDGQTITDKTSSLPAYWQGSTANHVGALLSAVGLVGTTPTAVVALCGATAGTDAPKLLSITQSAGAPTCTDITPVTLPGPVTFANLQVRGLTYSANDGLWGLTLNDGAGGHSYVYTSPDLATWTQVLLDNVYLLTGLATVGNVWVTSRTTAFSSFPLMSGNVGALGSAATWTPASTNMAVTGDGLGGLFSNGGQLVAASDTAVVVSYQVGV